MTLSYADSPAVLVCGGLRDLLISAGVATWEEDPASYGSNDTGMSFVKVPKSPDRMITFTPFDVQDTVPLLDRVIRVQVRVRGSRRPLDAERLSEQVFRVFHARHHLVWGGLKIARIRRESSGNIGPDENDRLQLSDNYEVLTQREFTA